MSLADYGFGLDRGKIFEKTASGRRKYLTDDELFLFLKNKGISLLEIDSHIQKLKTQASTEKSISDLKLELVQELNPFKNLLLVVNSTNRSDIVFYRNGADTEVISSLDCFDSKMLRAVLRKYEPDFLDELHKTMASIISSKDWTLISDLSVLDICFNTGLFNVTVEKLTVTADLHPAVLENSDKIGLITIPFKPLNGVKLSDLHPFLKDFLERTENHEFLCALLYSHFVGNLLPYVIYLRGDGGDGKTSFINMLGKLARSYATFDGGERFNYFNMYGKSIIALNENESSKLMQNRVLKTISGGNYVQIEGKGKNGYAGQVRGLIIVDSNYDLELLGREDEKRRLRYFRVSPVTKNKDFVTIAQDHFINQMSSTANEFLNYCKDKYEKLHVPGSYGLIQDNPNHEQTFQELVDVMQEHRFNEFYSQVIEKRYIKEGKCDSLSILVEIERRFPKDIYVVRNFKKYLEVHHNVKTAGKFFIGLSKFDKELNDAMPI